MRIDISIPVLNEEASLESQVLVLLNYLEKFQGHIFRIVIADNGSKDKTEEIGRQLEHRFGRYVRYLRLEKKGVGLALKTSWLSSNADLVGYMDLDFATDLSHLDEVISLFQQNEVQIVNGSRLLPGALVINRTSIRELTSRSFNWLVRFLLGVSLTDGMCGFKFFKKSVAVKLIESDISTDGWIFSTEILVKALWSGIEVHEIPVKWTDDRQSKVKLIGLSWTYFVHLFHLSMQKHSWIKQHTRL